MTITMENVESSAIAAIGYHAESRTLRIRFTSSGNPEWDYAEVPAWLWSKLRTSRSVGKMFYSEVKSRFPARKVSP